MCSLCQLPVAKNHIFGKFWHFWALLYRRSFTDEGQIWWAIADPRYRSTCEIASRSVVLWRRKTPIFAVFLPFFGLRHLVMSPIIINLRKLSTGAQLQTFPYPTASKSFLYSNAFMAKSGAQTLPNQQCQSTEGNYRIRIREKMLEFSSAVLHTPSPYLRKPLGHTWKSVECCLTWSLSLWWNSTTALTGYVTDDDILYWAWGRYVYYDCAHDILWTRSLT